MKGVSFILDMAVSHGRCVCCGAAAVRAVIQKANVVGISEIHWEKTGQAPCPGTGASAVPCTCPNSVAVEAAVPQAWPFTRRTTDLTRRCCPQREDLTPSLTSGAQGP